MTAIDIRSNYPYPANALSNFAAHSFSVRGEKCASMEGFLQGLKFENVEMQRSVFLKVGYAAFEIGQTVNWKASGLLYFKGQPIDRLSDHYQFLLDEAYDALFEQNEGFRKALLATGDAVLQHSNGRSKQSETVLTKTEFCSRLMKLRKQLRDSQNRILTF
jgi:predicted NAD-dependent protein-ADP-ribosyltransferase YbiA (DUF1768 family)